MGMSNDFESGHRGRGTMVRIGTAIFGRETMKPWGGRFKDQTDTLMERFSASYRVRQKAL